MTDSLKLVRGFKVAYPIFIERSYKRQLVGLVRNLELLTLELLFESHYFHNSFNNAIRKDDVIDDFEDLIRKINATIVIEVNKTVGLLPKRFEAVRSFVGRSFTKSLVHVTSLASSANLAPSIAISAVDVSLLKRMWIEQNTRLIKSIPANVLVKIQNAVYDAVTHGESMPSLAKQITQIFTITDKRATIIARDQMSKLKSNLNKHNDLAHGLTMYEWSSCQDGAVRKSHEVLHGKICSWNDPSIYKNKLSDKWKKRASINAIQKHVGEDILCRCTNIVIHEMRAII